MNAAYYLRDKSFEVRSCDPRSPTADEVRIKVSHCGVCGTDLHIYNGHMDHRIRPPQVIGHEMSGFIEEVGDAVTDLSVGDPVVVRPLVPCNDCATCRSGLGHICPQLNFLGIDSPGAFQANWTVPAITVHKLPLETDIMLAALVEPLAVACHDVRLAEVADGEKVVVLGGGPIGLLIALVARSRGAEVLLVEINPFRLESAARIGLTVMNHKTESLVEQVKLWTGGVGADAVFEVSGSSENSVVLSQVLRPRGRVVVVAIFSEAQPVNLFDFFWKELRMVGVRVYEPADYEEAIRLVSAKTLPLSELITAVHPLKALPEVFDSLSSQSSHMKILFNCAD